MLGEHKQRTMNGLALSSPRAHRSGAASTAIGSASEKPRLCLTYTSPTPRRLHLVPIAGGLPQSSAGKPEIGGPLVEGGPTAMVQEI